MYLLQKLQKGVVVAIFFSFIKMIKNIVEIFKYCLREKNNRCFVIPISQFEKFSIRKKMQMAFISLYVEF